MKVSIYADASVNDACAAFGAVVVRDNTKIEHSGTIEGYRNDTCWAELKAAEAALRFAVEGGHVSSGDIVRIFTDSDIAVQWINGEAPRGQSAGRSQRRARMGAIYTEIASIARGYGFSVRAIWIKGHQPVGANPHADYNRRCDRLAAAVTRTAKRAKKRRSPDQEEAIRQREAEAAVLRARDLARDREQKERYRAKRAEKLRAKMGKPIGKRYQAFWERPDWSGGDNLADPGTDAFWMLPPLPAIKHKASPFDGCRVVNYGSGIVYNTNVWRGE